MAVLMTSDDDNVLYVGMDIAGWSASKTKEAIAVAVLEPADSVANPAYVKLLDVSEFSMKKTVKRLANQEVTCPKWHDLLIDQPGFARGIGYLQSQMGSVDDARAVLAIDAPFRLPAALYDLPELLTLCTTLPALGHDKPEGHLSHRETEEFVKELFGKGPLSSVTSYLTSQAMKAGVFVSLVKKRMRDHVWIWPFAYPCLYPFGAVRSGPPNHFLKNFVTLVEAYPASFLSALGIPCEGYKGKKTHMQAATRGAIVGFLRSHGVPLFESAGLSKPSRTLRFAADSLTQHFLIKAVKDENGNTLDAILCALTAIAADKIRWGRNYCCVTENHIWDNRIRREGWICIPRTHSANCAQPPTITINHKEK
jgi:hypothetical protein